MAKIFALLVDVMEVGSNNLEMGEDTEDIDMGEASLPPGWVVRAAGMREVPVSSFGIFFVIIKIIFFIIITRWWSPPPATSSPPGSKPSSIWSVWARWTRWWRR